MSKQRVTGNFGEGIARSAVLPDYSNQYLQIAENRRVRRKAQEDKEDEEWRKYLQDVNVKGVHRLDQQQANEHAAKTVHAMSALRASNPHNWRNMMPELMTKFQSQQNEFLSRKAYLDQLDKDYDAANKAGLATPAQKQLMEAIRTGAWGDIERMKPDQVGSIKFDPKTKGIGMTFAPALNKGEYDRKILVDDYQTDLSFESKPIPGAPAGAEAVITRRNTPDDRVVDFNMRALSGEPGYLKRAEYEFMAQNRLPQGYESMPEIDEANITNPQTKFGVLYQENLKDLMKMRGTRTDVSIQKPHKAAKDDSFKDKGLEEMKGRIVLDEPITVVHNKGGKTYHKQYKSTHSLSIPTSAYTIITADKSTLDLQTGKFFDKQSQFSFKPGSIKVVRPTPGAPYEPVVFGQALDSKIPLDENGVPRFEAGPQAGQEKPLQTDVMVPLDKVKGLLLSKYKVELKWAYEAAALMNEAEKTKATNKKQEADPLGLF